MDVISYIRLIRFRYHITFLVVIVGALALTSQPFLNLVLPLLIMYLCFNVLLYGGLYTLNDIADVKSDSSHPEKKNRPLPSGKISISNAYIFAFLLILLGLVIAYYYFGTPVFLLFLLFIVVNLFYTRIAKRIPYLEILFNSLTYPMRFLLGALLVSAMTPDYLLLAVFFLAFGIASVRRVIEKRKPGSEARKVLKYYTERKLIVLQVLAFILILTIALLSWPMHSVLQGIIILLYIIFVFGIYVSKHIINFYNLVL